MRSFDRLVEHLRNLLRREKGLRAAAQNEDIENLKGELQPLLVPLFSGAGEALLSTNYKGDILIGISIDYTGGGAKTNLLIDGKKMLEVLTHEQFMAVTDAIERWHEERNE